MRFSIRIACATLCLALLCPSSPANAASTQGSEGIRAGQEAVESAVRKAGNTGIKAERWNKERQALLNEARQLLFDIDATRFAATRQETYVATENDKIQKLTDRLDAARATRNGLEPVMEALYAELAESISTGLPFASDEREARLIRVRRALDDPDSPAANKLGSLLEALRIEAGYGLAMEAEDAVATVDGTPMALTMLRVGRLALLRFPASGDWVERYDRQEAAWVRLDDAPTRDLIKAVQISRKRRIADIVTLPIGSAADLTPEPGDHP